MCVKSNSFSCLYTPLVQMCHAALNSSSCSSCETIPVRFVLHTVLRVQRCLYVLSLSYICNSGMFMLGWIYTVLVAIIPYYKQSVLLDERFLTCKDGQCRISVPYRLRKVSSQLQLTLSSVSFLRSLRLICGLTRLSMAHASLSNVT